MVCAKWRASGRGTLRVCSSILRAKVRRATITARRSTKNLQIGQAITYEAGKATKEDASSKYLSKNEAKKRLSIPGSVVRARVCCVCARLYMRFLDVSILFFCSFSLMESPIVFGD